MYVSLLLVHPSVVLISFNSTHITPAVVYTILPHHTTHHPPAFLHSYCAYIVPSSLVLFAFFTAKLLLVLQVDIMYLIALSELCFTQRVANISKIIQ